MPKAICEDCGSLVEAKLTHNGICAVGHYVHCGWGHQLSPDDLIKDDVAEIIARLEAKLATAVEALDRLVALNDDYSPFGGELLQDRVERTWQKARTTLAELTGGKTDD